MPHLHFAVATLIVRSFSNSVGTRAFRRTIACRHRDEPREGRRHPLSRFCCFSRYEPAPRA
jgi:hypothetical protein